MARQGGSKRDAWLIFALLLVIQLACFRGTSKLTASHEPIDTSLWKRSEDPSVALLPGIPPDLGTIAKHSTLSPAPSTTTPSQHSPTGKPPRKDKDGQETQCEPIPFSKAPSDVCSHIISHCEASGHFDYLRFYYCAGVGHDAPDEGKNKQGPFGVSVLRALCLVGILCWMLFLFSWVGVVASDFFCPNLSTIASRLGLNESTAGVTFLAFGNGSPDVFSTFGAMKTGSGSLAIGELVGAASFIVSVISGSMMLIAPFRVKPWPFCRDVGFFTVAVALILTFLFDGKLTIFESITLICLYVLYATTVIVGSWWQERRRQKRMMIAAARDEYNNSTGDASSIRSSLRSVSRDYASQGVDMERSQLLSVPGGRSPSAFSPSEYQPEVDPFEAWASDRSGRPGDTGPGRGRSGATTPERGPSSNGNTPAQTPNAGSRAYLKASKNRPGLVPRHSLLSAIEFRDVVLSLRQDASADRSQEIFQSWEPERFLPHHHHHHRRRHSRDSSLDIDPSQTARKGHSRVASIGPGVAGFRQGFSSPTRDRRKTIGSHDDTEVDELRHTLTAPRASSPLVDFAGASAGVEDPWREHLPDDGCEPLGPPALPLVDGSVLERRSGAAGELRKSLPKLDIPRWETGFAQRENGDPLRKTSSIPSIKVTGGDGGEHVHFADSGEGLVDKPRLRRKRAPLEWVLWKLQVAFFALFPSLRHVHAKSWVGTVISFLTAPAILMLNLTLPVVDDEADRSSDEDEGELRLEGDEASLMARSLRQEERDEDEDRIIQLGTPSPGGSIMSAEERVEAAEREIREEHAQRDRDIASALRHLPESAGSPLSFGSGGRRRDASTPTPVGQHCSWEEEAEEEELRRSTNRFLILAQCIFAPSFVAWAILSSSGSNHLTLKVSGFLVLGAALSACSFIAMKRKDSGRVRYSDRTVAAVGTIRCCMGFIVSVMWIMTIVDEVVSILQTVGLIAGISDAILGLTVFAVGNSLGDLVANVTIARLGHPVMAISACFAGPLLNLLLGIGISGTWLLSGHSSQQPWTHTDLDGIYPIDFSPTLLVSGLGLLFILVGTLIAVPMNGFHLTRPLGLSLIAGYAVIMTLNLITEIFWVRPETL